MKKYIILIFVPVFLLMGSMAPARAVAQNSEKELLNWLALAPVVNERIDLAESSLLICKSVYPKIDVKKYVADIDRMAEEIRKDLGKRSQPEQIISAINKYLYQKKGAQVYPIEIKDRMEKFMLNKVMDSMKGNCLGFSTLYFSLAERLDLPLKAVVIPHHVFLRYDQDGTDRNIEATAGGTRLSPDDYIKRTKEMIGDEIPEYAFPEKVTFRKLSEKQFLALILYNRGVFQFKHGEPNEAIADFTRAARLDPTYSEIYKSRSGLYLNQVLYNKATQDLEKANRLEPNCPQTLHNLGLAYFHLEKFDEALKSSQQTIKLAPDYAEAYYNCGVIYSRQKNNRLALENLNKAINLKPEHGPSYFARGMIHFNLEAFDHARVDFNKSIEMGINLVDAHNNRGVIYANEEFWEEAVDDFKKAIELDKKFADAHNNLTITYYKMHRYLDALPYAKKYLQLTPKDHPKRSEASKLYQELKRLTK